MRAPDETGRPAGVSRTVRSGVRGLGTSLRTSLGSRLRPVLGLARPALNAARPVLEVVRPLGWLALAGGLVLLLAGAALGWAELTVLGIAALVVLLLALPWLLGRTRVEIELLLDPERVTAGGTVTASLGVANRAERRTGALLLDLPVGASTQRYDLPGLAPGAEHEETFTIRTSRRGVIPVGPAVTRRADPLGLVSRDVRWSGVREVLVRPQLVALESLGGGLLRDLEGVSTESVSQADLAFHALREYVPGDDLRHVHWRSSAKVSGSSGGSALLVRQYLDTRRSHATLVVDDARAAWASEDDFETAMAVAGSLVMRALLDEFQTTMVCGEHAGQGQRALDTVCRAELGGQGMLPAARAAAQAAPDTSLVFLLGGAETSIETLRRAAACFEPEVRRIAIRVEPIAKSTVSGIENLTVLHLADRDDLAGLLRWSLG